MNTTKWQDDSPTHQEWSNANNEGFWWLKTHIPSFKEDGLVFPATAIYDIVQVGLQIDSKKDNLWEVVMNNNGGRLSFSLHGKSYCCDELPESFRDIQWQPVIGHSDN